MADDPSVHKRAFSYPLPGFHPILFHPVLESVAQPYDSFAGLEGDTPRPLVDYVARLGLNDPVISMPPIMETFADRSLDEVVKPSELPIGSELHLGSFPRTGVIKIANIPYTLTRQEVVQFLGRNARLIPPEQGCAVHIIMERSTGKTLDCFAELSSPHCAREIVHNINRILETGRSPRMGSRHVDVSLSSRDELLRSLFPHAKCISWVDGRPIQMPNDCEWSSGFNGFLSDEELFCVLRHAEIPGRSAFASKVPQRTYESMISTIWKFPWFSTTMYTVHARKKLYDTLRGMIIALVARMDHENTVGLDQKLLHELVTAGLNCPAFNPRMKYTLAYFGRESEVLASMPRDYILCFPFDTLVWLPQFDFMTLRYYASLISYGRVSNTDGRGLEQRWNTSEGELLRIYGPVWFEWNEEVAMEKKYNDAVAYERRVLRELVVTGYLYLSRKQSTASSIGTAPKSLSPTPSAKSNDSQKTVSAVNVGGDPLSPAVPMTPRRASGAVQSYSPPVSPSPATGGSRHGIGFDWMLPSTPRIPSQGANPYTPPSWSLRTNQHATQSSPWYPSTHQDNERWATGWRSRQPSYGARSQRGHSSRYLGRQRYMSSRAQSPW